MRKILKRTLLLTKIVESNIHDLTETDKLYLALTIDSMSKKSTLFEGGEDKLAQMPLLVEAFASLAN